MKRAGFTLIELMISISILSIMMIFLYQSYASLNKSNHFYKKEVGTILKQENLKKILFLDFSLALYKGTNSIKILNQEKNEDVVFMQSKNSLHKNHNPYIAYIKKDTKLYRLESLKEFKTYPLNMEDTFSIDELGIVDGFRVYKAQKTETNSTNTIDNLYLIHIDFKKGKDILLKSKVLNGY
jgi:prepilin-type N-terminal cleavage/methylation domain-containing protein